MQLAFLRAIGVVSVAVIAPASMTQAGRVQLPGLTIPSNATADRASVVQIFHESYHAYRCGRDIQGIVPRPEFDVCPRKYAFGHDEVAPLSRKPYNPRNGWGATIVDSMSTMVCKSRYLPYVFGLNHDLSTSWDSLYDNCYSPFPLTVPNLRLKYRTSSMKHSTSRRTLTSRNRTLPILLGRSLAAQTVSCVDDVLQPL